VTHATQPQGKIKVAVITGSHPFDVPNFHALFRAIPDIDAYPQDLENFAADWGEIRKGYDALVFFNMHGELPAEGPIATAIAELGETSQGIVVLHHAILAFPKSPQWSELVGLNDRSFEYFIGESVHIEVANPDHAITQGMTDWDLLDETYTMADPGADSQILLTTHHPRSMHAIAWTRKYRSARVFCYQSGHDKLAWLHPQFREVLARGIRWSARRI